MVVADRLGAGPGMVMVPSASSAHGLGIRNAIEAAVVGTVDRVTSPPASEMREAAVNWREIRSLENSAEAGAGIELSMSPER